MCNKLELEHNLNFFKLLGLSCSCASLHVFLCLMVSSQHIILACIGHAVYYFLFISSLWNLDLTGGGNKLLALLEVAMVQYHSKDNYHCLDKRFSLLSRCISFLLACFLFHSSLFFLWGKCTASGNALYCSDNLYHCSNTMLQVLGFTNFHLQDA